MATRKNTPPAEAQSSESTTTQAAGFDKLLSRLLNVVHHVRLVDQRLFDLQGVPEELKPAAVALHDATEALDTLYDELDSWHARAVAIVDATGLPAESEPASGVEASAGECFHENENDMPIAGTPAPLPCPFCASRDVSVVIERRPDTAGGTYVYAHVQCDGCGCEAGGAGSNDEDVVEAIEAGGGSGPYCTVMAAARRWNERRGS